MTMTKSKYQKVLDELYAEIPHPFYYEEKFKILREACKIADKRFISDEELEELKELLEKKRREVTIIDFDGHERTYKTSNS